MAVSACSPVLGLNLCVLQRVLKSQLKTISLLLTCGSLEQKPHLLPDLVDLGACFSGGVLKVRVLDIGSNPFASQGKTNIWLCWDLVYECGSDFPTHFNVGIFSLTLCEGITQLVSGSLSIGIAPCIAIDLVCPCGKVSSGAPCFTILE